jgi:GNAT superfamily N-acetyltransferase
MVDSDCKARGHRRPTPRLDSTRERANAPVLASDLALTGLSAASFRVATPEDADTIARLHADSWRRHYRGAYSDAFLDGEVLADRIATWRERLREPDPRRCTLLAECGEQIGFANTYLEDDAQFGALLDNLHVAAAHQRQGVGASLVALTARAVAERRPAGDRGLYLWVLEQNSAARAFYEALGAVFAGREPVSPPGGVPGRLHGNPFKLRYAWSDAAALAEP